MYLWKLDEQGLIDCHFDIAESIVFEVLFQLLDSLWILFVSKYSELAAAADLIVFVFCFV